MKNTVTLLALAFSSVGLCASDAQWLTIDNDVLAKIQPKLNKSVQIIHSANGASIAQFSSAEVEALSSVIHHELHRCGGFIAHESFEEAQNALSSSGNLDFAKKELELSIEKVRKEIEIVRKEIAQASNKTIIWMGGFILAGGLLQHFFK